MTFTLWRGTECLGKVVAEFPANSALVYGLFLLTSAFTDIGSLMQVLPRCSLAPQCTSHSRGRRRVMV